MKRNKLFLLILFALSITSYKLGANEVEITKVKFLRNADGTYYVSVSLKHQGETADHYADKWELIDAQGNILATRILAHPHESEKVFTRSLNHIVIPEDLDSIYIRAHDTKHAYAKKLYWLKLNEK